MLCSCPNGIGGRVAKLMPALGVILTFAVLFSTLSFAQQNSTPVPPEQAQFVTGVDVTLSDPAEPVLGEIARLKVPTGYRFYDAKNAVAFRESLKNVKGLLGFLKSEAGGWEVLLRFDKTGYVKVESENLAEVTKTFSTLSPPSNKAAAAAKVSWQVKPDYSPADHALEWAIREEAPNANSSSKIKYTAQLLARRGVLNIIATCEKGFDREALRDLLVKGINFNPGQRYADFQPNDQTSSMALTALVGYNPPPESDSASESILAAMTPVVWFAVGGVVIAIIGTSFFVFGRARRRMPKAHPIRPKNEAMTASSMEARTTSVAGSSISTNTSPQNLESVRNPITPKTANLKPIPTQATATPRKNAVLARKLSADNLRKKRAFDYNRYFADLMSTVSSHGPTMEAAANNGLLLERNGSPLSGASNTTSSPDGTFTSNTDLIAHQTTLIEEQRRLIQEQSKLIEEKSKLIAEKNHLLKLQAELIENKML